MWEYLWEVATPGDYTIIARAISKSGQVQPTAYDPLHGGYMIHHSRVVCVNVEEASKSAAQVGDPQAYLYDMNAFAEENQRLPLDAHMEFAVGGGI
jgi:hypothetical protein